MAPKTKTSKPYQAGPVWTSEQAPSMKTAPLPSGPSCQPCPDCGGLTCLCRPRFFAGQLLTEKDLNQLDSYIKAKNQLHNRYLFGSGVVCGLEVRCGPCGDGVTVTPGYALSPCGDDIVVCKLDQVDVCGLISQCTKSSAPDCRPYAPGGSKCDDLVEDWILAIRYEETPSRGITALTGAGQGCGCSCGCSGCTGSSGCGCGGTGQSGGCCGQTQTASQPIANKVPRRGSPPACEPTLTCETYRYEIFKAPVTKDRSDNPFSVAGLGGLASLGENDMFQRMACCVKDITATVPPVPQQGAAGDTPQWRQAVVQWLCTVKQILADHFKQAGNFDCEIPHTLQNIAFPDPQSQSFLYDTEVAVFALVTVWLEELVACFCSAALPACPPPGDPRVPLALVSVRRSDCGIVSVCNWTPMRKHVMTFPTLDHWFGWIPIGPVLREIMHALCCNVFNIKVPEKYGHTKEPPAAAQAAEAVGIRANVDANETIVVTGGSNPNDAPLNMDVGRYGPAGPAGTFAEALVKNLRGDSNLLRRSDLIDAMTKPINVGSAAMTRQQDVDQLAGTPAMRLIAEALRPLANAIPTGTVPADSGSAAPAAAPASSDDLAAMRSELAGLKEKLGQHEEEIARLKTSKG